MIKKLSLAAAALLLASPAFAHGGDRHESKHERHWDRGHHRPMAVMPAPRVFYAPAPRVVYAPPPRVVYAPAPRVVYAPAPAVVYPPVGGGAISIRVNLPL